ncbi:hypothetical protein F5Y14DRAFT_125605 [Nemania sp. NC0429]|nr:hypothetical protein F5Y14DRAFT_125605 [Nemania sp. NC0429]
MPAQYQKTNMHEQRAGLAASQNLRTTHDPRGVHQAVCPWLAGVSAVFPTLPSLTASKMPDQRTASSCRVRRRKCVTQETRRWTRCLLTTDSRGEVVDEHIKPALIYSTRRSRSMSPIRFIGAFIASVFQTNSLPIISLFVLTMDCAPVEERRQRGKKRERGVRLYQGNWHFSVRNNHGQAWLVLSSGRMPSGSSISEPCAGQAGFSPSVTATT